MYKYTHFIQENVAPKDAKKIVVYNSAGDDICDIPLGRLRQPTETKRYSFLAISDVHIELTETETSKYRTAEGDLRRALEYADSNCDFTCVCGDLTSGGLDKELTKYKTIVSAYSKPIYAVGGNHDSIPENQTSDRIDDYTGQPMYYSFTKGDDVFIMLSHYGKYHEKSDNDEGREGWFSSEFVSVEELQWLYQTLETNRDKRCFIFNHVFPYEDGVGDANRYYGGGQWRTKDGGVGQAFINLLKHYTNTILFHGHSHLRFSLQEVDKKANYSSEVGYRSVHIPSLAVPRDRIDDKTQYVYAESEGYVVDVYDDYIILNGRDFVDNEADGHIIPIATYKIDTTLQTIPANTFTDSTGTITT